MNTRRLTKQLGLIAMFGACAVGVALYLRPAPARTSSQPGSLASGTPAIAAGGPAAPATGACMQKESGEAKAARFVPLAYESLDFSDAEKARALEIMTWRNSSLDALPTVPSAAMGDGGNPALENRQQVDKESRARLIALLGKARAQKFYATYFELANGRAPSPGAPATDPESR